MEVPEPNDSAETSDLALWVFTIWLIIFAVLALPLLVFTLLVQDPKFAATSRLPIVAGWGYPALILVSFCLRKRHPKLIWLPALGLAGLVLAVYFSG